MYNSVNEMFDTDDERSRSEAVEEFFAECEREAAKLEITVDYYLAEFY